jgi:arginine repressor
MDGLIGTVAGDDTIFCIAEEKLGGKALAIQLRGLAGLEEVGK